MNALSSQTCLDDEPSGTVPIVARSSRLDWRPMASSVETEDTTRRRGVYRCMITASLWSGVFFTIMIFRYPIAAFALSNTIY